MSLPLPSEYEEQVALRQYCDLMGYAYFAVPNETYTSSWNQKRRNRAKGVVKGVPDFWCIVGDKLLAIELKRLKRSVISPEQKIWLERLSAAGVHTKVAYGADEAIAFITNLTK